MQKSFYITTAIPYVNAKPHIGNALDYVLADTLSRYHKQQGETVFFQVGVDEHGNKIAAKAEEAGITPQAYTDQMVTAFHDMLGTLNILYTDFIRTTDERHIRAAQAVWQKLSPYIYKDSYEGWYCVGHEAFFTTKEVEATGGVCPDHQKPYEKLTEENYFFQLSAFGDKIKEKLADGSFQIVPEFRQAEIIRLIDEGLQDISISRPKKHLSWGVPVPGDDEHVMYVWIDALSNYVSVLGYPDGDLFKTFWPADVQVIGKDILRFHAAIWPAMLIALGIPLPKQLLVHGFVNVGGAKMSKTVGNVVDPIEVATNYGADAFRYFFVRHIPTQDDGDFTWERFENAYNGELGNELGNLVQRVASMIKRYQQGVIGQVPEPMHDNEAYHQAMQELRLNDAFEEVWKFVRELNVYLEEVKPWQVAKEGEGAAEHLGEILAYSAGSLLQIAELLVPLLPDTSERITTLLGGEQVPDELPQLFPKIYLHTPDPHAQK
jgi:methionyl-tRNA synthetase